MRIKTLCLIISVFLLGTASCGSKEDKKVTESLQFSNYCFTDEGIVCLNNQTHLAEYYDYQTGVYMPLCGRVNCTHNEKSENCSAVRLKNISTIGRLGDKWYYLKTTEFGKQEFFSCDLDGTQERVIGEFQHFPHMKCIYFENSCIMVGNDICIDEKDEMETSIQSCIYRYCFDTGKEEKLCPEKSGYSYTLLGKWNDYLVYEEITEGLEELKVLDLKTKSIIKPLDGTETYGGTVGENKIVCNIKEENGYGIIEIDMESWTCKEIMTGNRYAAQFLWEPEMKVITVLDKKMDEDYYQIYYYSESEDLKLVKEGLVKNTWFIPRVSHGDMVIGQVMEMKSDFELSVIEKEDFFSGKDSWQVLEY